MFDTYVAQIAEAQEAADSLAEHERLQRLAGSLEGLKAAQQKQQELDRLWDELCQVQADLRQNIQEALTSIPAWRNRFREAHAHLLAVADESTAAQAALLLGGDCLVRLYKIEKKIQTLNGQSHNPTTAKMWQSAGGCDPDLDPLRGVVGDWWAGYFKGKFLFRPTVGLRHFFRG